MSMNERKRMSKIERDDRIVTELKEKNNERRIIYDDIREIGCNECKLLLLYGSCDCRSMRVCIGTIDALLKCIVAIFIRKERNNYMKIYYTY